MSGADVSSRSYSEAAMKLREALIAQSPSLELQRAAANEIARLDAQIEAMRIELISKDNELVALQEWVDEQYHAPKEPR